MSIVQHFDENAFRNRVRAALEQVKTIVENARKPQYALDVPHQYDDKYALAESLVRCFVAANLQVLERLGMTDVQREKATQWAKTHTVTLRLKAEEKCKFLRKVVREVESATSHVTTWNDGFKRKDTTVTKVTDYFYQFDVTYQIVLFPGNRPEEAIVINSRSASLELKTASEHLPHKESVVHPNIDVHVDWLLIKTHFAIDRSKKTCRTPRRNEDAEAALQFSTRIAAWGDAVQHYFRNTLFLVQVDHGLDLNILNTKELFVPVLPLLENAASNISVPAIEGEKAEGKGALAKIADANVTSSPVVPASLAEPLLHEHSRAITAKFAALAKVYPTSKLITPAEAQIVVLGLHLRSIAQAHIDGILAIEAMLRQQLVAAIGKEVGPDDFNAYLRFHCRRLFRTEYVPSAFSYAVRRPDHAPEGVVSIEVHEGSNLQPIATLTHSQDAVRPMYFALDASSRVSFLGERHLHGYIATQFEGRKPSPLTLIARARQFSSYIVLVGRISGRDQFDPTAAMIVQNKDEFRLPLYLETIPSPKEFRDAIESLSPEQQRFAKAYRSLQLESTLFGVCVVQIKPQLEKLLRLPSDSLTKEIELSENLMELFKEFQIPSDLVSYAGREDASVEQKVDAVRGYVKRMFDMIQSAKDKELAGERQKQQMRMAELAVPPPSPSVGYSETAFHSPSSLLASPPRMMMAMSPLPPPPPGAVSVQQPQPAPPMRSVQRKQVASAPAPPKPTTQSVRKPMVTTPKPAEPKAPKEHKQPSLEQPLGGNDEEVEGDRDVTKLPTEMEAKFDQFDEDHTLRPTILNVGDTWEKKYFTSLLSKVKERALDEDEQKKHKDAAYDLLDALTRSGALPLVAASLHVLVCATHCFDKSLIDTVVQDSVNPVEKVERSALIVASAVHQASAVALLKGDQVERVGTYSPLLLKEAGENDA